MTPTKSKGPMLCIVIEGGQVQSVVTNDPNAISDLQIMVIDYDTDGMDESDLIKVRQESGRDEEAAAYCVDLQPAGIDLGSVADQIDAKMEA